MGQMFFDGWMPLVRTLVLGVLAYVALVAVLRISGKRTLSKWNVFDFIVTIALGSSVATVLVSKDVSLAQGLLGLSLLVLLQYMVTWLSVRSPAVHRIVKAKPSLLLYEGTLQRASMLRQRVTETELHAALREHGIASVEEVGAVILEADGSFSVIRSLPQGGASTLEAVEGYAELQAGRD